MVQRTPWPLTLALFLMAAPAAAQESDDTSSEDSPASSSDSDAEKPTAASRIEALEARLEALEEANEELEQRLAEDELERLVEKAEMFAIAPPEEQDPDDRVFTSGARAMQMTNPEISMAGDMLASLTVGEDLLENGIPMDTGFPVRAMSVHVQSVLDPYSLFKGALEFYPGWESTLSLEELYMTWFGQIPAVSITVGRFRQHFGIVNRWHQHDLDQTDYPLALGELYGDFGVMGNGVSVKWFMPRLWAHAQELTFDITDGNNPDYFSQESYHLPTEMIHLKNYWDLSPSTYLQWGLSGSYGYNNPAEREETEAEALARGANPDAADYEPQMVDPGWGRTVLGGSDLTLYWSPPKRARYRSLTWRSELYTLHQEDENGEWSNGMGAYSYVQYQLGAKWFVGYRQDWLRPDLSAGADADAFGFVPYATFWQSEFVYLRGEYRCNTGLTDQPEHRFLVQVDWAAGPHKHERY